MAGHDTDLSYRRSYNLPRGFSVEFVLDGDVLDARWSPAVPHGKLGRKLRPAYRRARADFLGSLGVGVLVVEL